MIKVGDVMLFNPNSKHTLFHYGIKNGEPVKITRVGREYSYYGLPEGETCFEIDFEVMSDKKQYKKFSSQYVGEDGCEF